MSTPPTPSVALVLVGAELVEGRTADGNGVWMARRVAEEGARLVRWSVVADDEAALAAALTEAARAAALVLVSGGLGPTDDDRTRAGVARALGTALRHDPEAWAFVEEVFRRRGREPKPVQRRQAEVPVGARWLPNPVGTAPGLLAHLLGATLLVFPGVPEELRALFEREALPRLRALPGRTPTALRTLCTAGLPETEVAALLGDLAHDPALALGWYPHQGEVEVSLRTHGPGCEETVERALALARARLGPAVLADTAPGERIEHSVVHGLARSGRSLATAESLTGGLVARLLTRVPGASAVFPGGWVTYSDAAKARDLGVPAALLAEAGAVSAPVAAAMARGARERAGTWAGLATTGVAGPGDQAAPDGPVLPAGTAFVALALPGAEPVVRRLHLPLPRELVQRRVAVEALDLLRRALA